MKIKAIILAILSALLLFAGCDSTNDNKNENGGQEADIVKLTADNFQAEVFESDKIVIVDFYADWCGPCKRLSPILDEIASEMPEVKVGKVNVDEELILANRYNVSSIPMLLIVKDGEIKQEIVGLREKEFLVNIINSLK